MSDVSGHDTEGLLPRSGILYFFYGAELQPGGMAPDDPGGHRVLYYDGESSELERAQPPCGLAEGEPFPACGLRFRTESTVADSESPYLPVLGFTDDESSQYTKGLIELGDVDDCYGTPYEKIHRMLGHPDTQQGDIYVWCELESSNAPKLDDALKDPDVLGRAVDWRLLLQVDSMEELHTTEEGVEYRGWMWGDLGRIYYAIRREHIEACDFSKVMLMHQCG